MTHEKATYCSLLQPIGLFLANGLVVGGWATAIPIVGRKAGLSESLLSVVLLSFAVGGIVAMLLTPRAIQALGTRTVSLAAGVGFLFLFPVVVGLSELSQLAIAAFFFGGCHGAMDVAMNASAIETERLSGRRFMSKLHGCFSLGAAVGAGTFGLILNDQPAMVAFWYSAIIATAMVLIVIAAGAKDRTAGVQVAGQTEAAAGVSDTERQAEHRSAYPLSAVVSLGTIAFCCLVAEGAMVDWLVKLFQPGEGPTVETATTGSGFVYASFAIGMSVCRFAGDMISHSVGDRRTIIIGCLVSSVSLMLVLMTRNPVMAYVPAMFAGAGLANVIPSAFRACGKDVRRVGQTLALVTTIGYAGFLFGPPVIGVIADMSSLRIALFVPAASLAVASVVAAMAEVLRAPAIVTRAGAADRSTDDAIRVKEENTLLQGEIL